MHGLDSDILGVLGAGFGAGCGRVEKAGGGVMHANSVFSACLVRVYCVCVSLGRYCGWGYSVCVV